MILLKDSQQGGGLIGAPGQHKLFGERRPTNRREALPPILDRLDAPNWLPDQFGEPVVLSRCRLKRRLDVVGVDEPRVTPDCVLALLLLPFALSAQR
jgi:hypothetical protein